MSTWKLVQRRCYDLLSNKYSLLVILVAFTCIFIGIIHFGEVWLVWSKEKYEAVFHSFNDNILGTSFQKKLCQHVPIDVVYTWVNGSDPKFLEDLQKYVPVTDVNVAASRFDDKDELRYSLRSLELYAPWVRHVYVVTNGQIPSWLDMDNPRLTLITHRDIFLDRNDLPSFSSPAIESHIHRIPGLSDKFLYFNDDVLLGAEVWPEDFVTKAGGQKVYLAWWVPDCSEVCPWAWVGDGACDPACNTTMCEFDGGDCEPTPIPTESEQVEEGSDYPYKFVFENQMRNRDAARILDILKRRNNEPEKVLANSTMFRSLKGYDYKAPKNEGEIFQTMIENSSKDNAGRNDDENVINRRLHKPKNNQGRFDSSETYVTPEIYVRSSSLFPVSHSVEINSRMGNENSIRNSNLNLDNFSSKSNLKDTNKKNDLLIRFDHYNLLRTQSQLRNLSLKSDFESSRYARSILKTNIRKILSSNVNLSDDIFKPRNSSQLNIGSTENLNRIERRNQLQRYLNDDIINLVHVNNSNKLYKYKHLDQEAEYEDSDVQPTQWKHRSRKLDTYAESLLYVNKIYNLAYGFERRRVPAHMPHLLDKSIVEDMHKKFKKEFKKTSNHRVRCHEDMQFAFSYFYFLTSEKINVSVETIFDMFDTDKSGTWSDREIRTLLSRIYPLPLDYSFVMEFENEILNCSKHVNLENPPQVPSGERYLDSTLPVVTKKLIAKCDLIAKQLNAKFGKRKRYKHEYFKGDRSEVFKMLTSNVSLTVQLLDELRKEPKKFICLNDNMDPARQSENEVVRALLGDFYRSLYPLRSSFELPAQYRNRFSHRQELMEWRASRTKARNLLLCLLTLLLFLTIYNLFYHQARRFLRFRTASILLV